MQVFYVNNAGKALFVWFRRRKDNEHLTSLVLGKYQQQEPRTNTEFSGRTGKRLSLWRRNFYGWVGSTVITHLQYLSLQINNLCT